MTKSNTQTQGEQEHVEKTSQHQVEKANGKSTQGGQDQSEKNTTRWTEQTRKINSRWTATTSETPAQGLQEPSGKPRAG